MPQFQSVVPWSRLNREGLGILVHPLTDGMVDDHGVYAPPCQRLPRRPRMFHSWNGCSCFGADRVYEWASRRSSGQIETRHANAVRAVRHRRQDCDVDRIARAQCLGAA
jgi:hypothetical protein